MNALHREHAVPDRVALLLRTALSVLITASACTACSAPAPPAAATPSSTPEPAGTSPPEAATQPGEVVPPSPSTPATPIPTTPVPTTTAPPKVESPLPRPTAPKPAVNPPPNADKPPDPPAPASAAGADQTHPQPTSISVYAMSRGKGVPAETRAAYKQIRALLEQHQDKNTVTALQTHRIGLEGETRLCAEFRTAREAQVVLAQINALASGIDLLNVIEEPCPPRKEYKP